MMALTYALQITVIGMTLVFFTIVLLWGLIVVIVRFNPEHAPQAETDAETVTVDETDIRKRAAAVAVAFALAQKAHRTQETFPLPPTAFVSAWQAVRRANQLNQKGPRR
jgi:Na+-transporting methylmalonyl-CoA/oxaloacetate decarboxylase gamma subunit